MSNNFTTAVLRANNERFVLKYIYHHKQATSSTLQNELSLSRPTVAQILRDLSQNDFIYTKGLADSTGGRKANLYEFNASIRISIGVEILIDRFELTAIDLYGDMLKYEKHTVPFSNTAEYYTEICRLINKFIDGLECPLEQILGVGIALQGLISADGRKIIYGKVLDCTGLTIDEFSSRIPYCCSFNHDAEAMANVELWFDPFLQNAIYLNIRSDVSGSIIINRSFFQDGAYKSGIFEHMIMVPNGKPCYCGKRGCVNAYCSTTSFLKPQEDIQNFFLKLRKGTASYEKRWNKYLDYLATAIDDFHMIINSNVILAGTLAKYLINDDIEHLHRIIQSKSAFPTDEKYISISNYSNLPACMGAALPFVRNYLDSIM